MSPRVRRHNPSSRTSLSSLLNSALGMLIPAQRLQSGDALVAPDNPGPGAYDYEMPYGNLLKPTYNVAIAEQCRELV